jgi:hypothetical protein
MIVLHGLLPAVTSAVVLSISMLADIAQPGMHWTQRAGSIVTVLAAYVAYVDAKRSYKFIDDSMYMNFELPYRAIAVSLALVGTLVWGYGDLIL